MGVVKTVHSVCCIWKKNVRNEIGLIFDCNKRCKCTGVYLSEEQNGKRWKGNSTLHSIIIRGLLYGVAETYECLPGVA